MRTPRITILVVASLLACGCRQKPPEREYHAGSGVAKAIDVDTGIVSMEWTNRKTGETQLLSGHITPETEIFINGVSAAVGDVRVGDRVEVTAYWEPEKREWSVTRVAVERTDSFMQTRPRTLLNESNDNESD